MDKIERMKELVEIIRRANRAYYQEGDEIMSNQEWDRLYDELSALEKETGVILSKSPTQNVGYEILSAFKKEKHPKKMLSLDKTKSREDLADWLGDREGFLSWKLDGLTIVLTYEDGILKKAVTRGNGEIGEVITENAKHFIGVPNRIPFQEKLVVRGEAVIGYADFQRINQETEGDRQYKNPRNLCAGTVRQLDTRVTAERNVRFIPFTLVLAEGLENNSYSGRLSWLNTLGFTPVEGVRVTKKTLPDAISDFEGRISTNDIPSDGLVLFYDDVAYGESLGATSKYPRNGMAFKWKDEVETTVLREIEWSASRTGLLNPVAVFDPVELEGTTVSRASVHNISIMEKLGLNIGDQVSVYKANMIIPQIAEDLTGGAMNPAVIPATCPVCGGTTRIKCVDDVKTLYCTNPSCAAKNVKAFVHFVGRDAMNIVGLSESTIEKFVALGYVTQFADLYHLDMYKDEIVGLDGFGEKSYEKLVQAVEDSRKVDVNRFLYSFGIDLIGRSASKKILSVFDSDLKKLRNASAEEISSIEGIGEQMALSLVSWFNSDAAKQMDSMLEEVELVPIPKMEESEGISGKTFVITGSLNNRSRKELKEYIEQKGGKVAGSVSKNTDYLINNDAASSSSKNKKAKELGVQIITEEEFEKI